MYSRTPLFLACMRTMLNSFQKMHGRFFAGRRIEASFFTGKQRFRRSGTGDDAEEDSEDAEKKRLENFTQWLMSEGD